MGSTENGAQAPGVRQLQEAGKAMAETAGTVAVDRIRVEVDSRSSRAAVELKAFAVAIRASSASLRDQGHDGQAQIVDEIAGRADRIAAHLVTADTDDLIEDSKRIAKQAADFARKEPVLAIAGAFTVGLLVPRALEAVSKIREQSEREGMADE